MAYLIIPLGVLICVLLYLKKNNSSKKYQSSEFEYYNGGDQLSLCIKLVVYTAKYCNGDNLESLKSSKLTNLMFKVDPKHYKARYIDLIKLIELASISDISSSDLNAVCEKINREKKQWDFDFQYNLLDSLFSVAYQPNGNNTLLQDLSKSLGISDFCFERISSNHKYKWENEHKGNNKGDSIDLLLLCTKLVIYTAKYCGGGNVNESTKRSLEDFIYLIDRPNYNQRVKDLEDWIFQSTYSEVSFWDLDFLCKKIKETSEYKKWDLELQKKLINALFSAVYQVNQFHQTLGIICKWLNFNTSLFDSVKLEYDAEAAYRTAQKKKEKKEKAKNQKEDNDKLFVDLTVELLAEAMKVDRSKMVCELDVIKAFILKYDKKKFQERVDKVKQYLSYEYMDYNVEEVCRKINKQFRQEYRKREDILRVLIDLVYADETCTNAELNFLRKVAERLKVSKTSFDYMRMKYENRKNKDKKEKSNKKDKRQNRNSQNYNSQSNSQNSQNNSQPRYSSELEKAYAALGIDRDATDKEIKASWRNLMRVNHPDLMESKGPDAVRRANEKCQEINKAFEVVKASRGMK
ncbi:MAG: TerB family tellurite resistance protein [Bacteroidales bacterium]|nr:TerB family tellurite resistance protein [Candidatus Scybalocola fimicaballi]